MPCPPTGPVPVHLSVQGAEYTAAKGKDGLYNFAGLVLGHHGNTIQRLQRGSGAKIEIHSKDGNLNGDHPPLDDHSLHALVQADSRVSTAGHSRACYLPSYLLTYLLCCRVQRHGHRPLLALQRTARSSRSRPSAAPCGALTADCPVLRCALIAAC
jgi:hypothetical protein